VKWVHTAGYFVRPGSRCNHAQIIGGRLVPRTDSRPRSCAAVSTAAGWCSLPHREGARCVPAAALMLARRGSAYGTRPKMTEVCTFADRTDARKYEEDLIIVLTVDGNEFPDCWRAGHPRFTPMKFIPASTYSVSPVIRLAYGVARYAHAKPTSIMSTHSPIGALAMALFSISSKSFSPEAARVLSGPGEMACTRIFCGPSSYAISARRL
jgi:hypothetical protein